jgi:hypothetical protein
MRMRHRKNNRERTDHSAKLELLLSYEQGARVREREKKQKINILPLRTVSETSTV